MPNTFTPNLGFPLLADNTRGGVYEFNRALVKGSQNAFLAVKNMTLSDPPASPVDGDAYLVVPNATGAWEGHNNEVAYYDNGWYFILPRAGFTVWDEATDTLRTYNNTTWFGGNTVADIGGGATLAQVRDKANELFAECRGHGLILN